MKPTIISIVFNCLFLFTYGQNTGHILLNSGWKFQYGDSIHWKAPEYDDTEWIDISPAGGLEYLTPENDYDGYCWYRISFYLPNSMKGGFNKSDSIYFQIGRIDDNDETYLNGELIGRNAMNATRMPDKAFANLKGFHDKLRNYALPLNHPYIQWGDMNTLAIRVYDIWLTGGIMNPTPKIRIGENWDGQIKIVRKTSRPKLLETGKPSEVSFLITNKSTSKDLKAYFIIDVFSGKSEIPLTNQIKHIHVPPGHTETQSLQFMPLIHENHYVSYKIIEESTNYSFGTRQMYGYIKPDLRVLKNPVQPVIKDKVPISYEPVKPRNIHIGGYLEPRIKVNTQKGLIDFPVQLIEPYITGEIPPWPIGEFLGKLVHGGTKMMNYGINDELLESMFIIVQTWISTQKNNGYMGTNMPGAEWQGWDVWDHKYVILGLLQFYIHTGYKPALKAAIKTGDLMCNTFGNEDTRRDLMHMSFHAGMANGSLLEPMVYLYKYTGNKKYLDFCYYILDAFEQENGPQIVSELNKRSGTVLEVGNAKGYEMMSCLIGMIQLYKINGDEKLFKAVKTAWEDIRKNRLYITGTSTSHELFQETGHLPAGAEANMGEGCVTAHWMYFSKELFKLTGEHKYIDEIDKSLYNHLLAAQHPVSGNIVYYCALQGEKWYMEPDMFIGPPLCCHTSVKRCISEIPEISFYQRDRETGILIYNDASLTRETVDLNGDKCEIKVHVSSDYPQSSMAKINIENEKKAEYTLSLRVPSWTNKYEAEINEKTYQGTPGEFLKIKRKWPLKEQINITMDFPVKILDGGESYPDHFAVKYGNQVLTVDARVNHLQDFDHVIFNKNIDPVLKEYKGELPKDWIGSQAFISNLVTTIDGKEVVLVPFSDASQTGGDIRVWIKSE